MTSPLRLREPSCKRNGVPLHCCRMTHLKIRMASEPEASGMRLSGSGSHLRLSTQYSQALSGLRASSSHRRNLHVLGLIMLAMAMLVPKPRATCHVRPCGG